MKREHHLSDIFTSRHVQVLPSAVEEQRSLRIPFVSSIRYPHVITKPHCTCPKCTAAFNGVPKSMSRSTRSSRVSLAIKSSRTSGTEAPYTEEMCCNCRATNSCMSILLQKQRNLLLFDLKVFVQIELSHIPDETVCFALDPVERRKTHVQKYNLGMQDCSQCSLSLKL